MPHTRQLIRKASSPIRRKRINLAKKRPKATRKLHVWFISKKQNRSLFYLADFDDEQNTALWCHHKKDGMVFHTEVGAYQFISTYLNSRRDVIIIQSESV